MKQEREIETAFGETLSWQYLDFAKKHQIKKWNVPTAILYAEKDNLTDGDFKPMDRSSILAVKGDD